MATAPGGGLAEDCDCATYNELSQLDNTVPVVAPAVALTITPPTLDDISLDDVELPAVTVPTVTVPALTLGTLTFATVDALNLDIPRCHGRPRGPGRR